MLLEAPTFNNGITGTLVDPSGRPIAGYGVIITDAALTPDVGRDEPIPHGVLEYIQCSRDC